MDDHPKYQNLVLALQEQQAGVERVRSRPVAMVLDPSSVCNLRCPFCIHGRGGRRPFHRLQLPVFRQVLAELGPYLFEVELFNWGEPLLHPDFLEMLSALKALNIRVRVSTHFALDLPDSFLESLIRLRLDVLTVSLDGMSPETYAKYRAGGDFRLAMTNLERLAWLKRRRKADLPRIDWQFLVFSFNEAELPLARAHARRLGVDLRPAAPFVDLDRHPSWMARDERWVMERYRDALRDHRRQETENNGGAVPAGEEDDVPQREAIPASLPGQTGEMPFAAVDFLPESAIGEGSPGPVASEIGGPPGLVGTPCDWLYLKAALNADGSFSPCCGLPPGEPSFGALNGWSFDEVWNGEAFRSARRAQTHAVPAGGGDSPICARCPFPEMRADHREKAFRDLDRAPREVRARARRSLAIYVRRRRWPGRLKQHALAVQDYLPYSVRQDLLQRVRGQLTHGSLRGGLDRLKNVVTKFK